MSKLDLFLICSDKVKPDDLTAEVYVDGVSVGIYQFGKMVTFEIKKKCRIWVQCGDAFSEEKVADTDRDYMMRAEYDYLAGAFYRTTISGDPLPLQKESQEKCKEDDDTVAGWDTDVSEYEMDMPQKLRKYARGLRVFVIVCIVILFCAGFIASIALASEGPVSLIVFGSCALEGVALYVQYILAGYFYFVARDKGYTDKAYLYIPFFLPLVGYILVAALPDKSVRKVMTQMHETPDN